MTKQLEEKQKEKPSIVKKLLLKIIFMPERFVPWLKKHNLHQYGLFRWVIDLLLIPADIIIIRSSFRRKFGRNPSFFHPTSFNEWISVSKIFNRRKVHRTWCDKLAVRDYIAKTLGAQYLTKLYWRGFDLNEARATPNLPTKFVIKANHTSSTLIIVEDRDTLDWEAAWKKAESWLKMDYAANSAEWQYRWMKPEILIEEFLDDGTGAPPPDYKFWTFYGVPKFIQMDENRFTNHTRTFFTCDDPPVISDEIEIRYPHNKQARPPRNFTAMRDIARSLAQRDIQPFLRVDFYEIEDRIIIGELTIHQGGGNEVFLDFRKDQAAIRYLVKPQGE